MKIKCKKCGYTWNTDSKLIYVSCPSCLQKVETKQKETEESEHLALGTRSGCGSNRHHIQHTNKKVIL